MRAGGTRWGEVNINRFLRWLDKPIDLLLWLGLIAGVLMMLHVSVDVAGRYLFNHPIEGTTEIVAAYYMVLVAYLPWAWLARDDRHIVAGFFKRIGSPVSTAGSKSASSV